jgi:hypothetical protein
MIHELGVKPGPVQVPHYIPNWVENIHAGVERAECCRDNEGTKRKITLDAPSSKGKRRRKHKSSRRQKKGGTDQNLASASSLDVEEAIVNENQGEVEKRSCRRQRKRKRLSMAEESEPHVDLVIANASPCHGAQIVGSACNIITTKGMPCVRSHIQKNKNIPEHTAGKSR